MSYSSLFLINKKYEGERVADFGNSWLFSPIVWSVLSDKTLPRKNGMIQSIIGIGGNDVAKKINVNMNASECTTDRICWELSNQQTFFSKDKMLVANAIRNFLKINDKYNISEEDGISVLKREHIIERFEEIANQIESIDEEEYPYFVWKNTSCDDGVERWFYTYNEEADNDTRTLKDCKELVTEFVVIEDGKITDFISNLKFKY